MTLPRQTEAEKRFLRRAEHGFDLAGAVLVDPVNAPRTEDVVCPETRIEQDEVVIGSSRRGVLSEFDRIGFPQTKKIAGAKRAVAERPGATFAAFDRRVVLHFRRLGRVEHDVKQLAPGVRPRPRQRISIGATIRV